MRAPSARRGVPADFPDAGLVRTDSADELLFPELFQNAFRLPLGFPELGGDFFRGGVFVRRENRQNAAFGCTDIFSDVFTDVRRVFRGAFGNGERRSGHGSILSDPARERKSLFPAAFPRAEFLLFARGKRD